MATRSVRETIEERLKMQDVHTREGVRHHVQHELARVANAIVRTLSPTLCEVVVHDFANPDASIVYIAGDVTKRLPGGSMSQIGLALMAEGDDAKDKLNYVTRTRDGKVLRSSTIPLRDQDGAVYGALCVNLDITSFVTLESAVKELTAGDGMTVLTDIHFGNDTAELAKVLLEDVTNELELGGPPRDLSQSLDFVHALDKRGFFGVRYSVQLLADYLGLSRATIYNYLERCRAS
jgi:predicted transcriptional regulator YheO